MKKNNRFLSTLVAAVLLSVIILLLIVTREGREAETSPDFASQKLIKLDGEARSGVPLAEVKGVVIHYTGVAGASSEEMINACRSGDIATAPHFIIGLKGEIIQCIPLSEQASVSESRNCDTIAIEVCHDDESGEFTAESYASLVKLTAWLCTHYGLTENNVLRHYDITGIECPLCFVLDEESWAQFKSDVKAEIK